jgi:hypothetical protein
MARTVSELGGGDIETLCCSPNVENRQSFYAYGNPVHATFFLGPFHRLTRERMGHCETLQQFRAGFDIILEDTTFQMYSPNRRDQVGFVAQHLKPDGIFLFVEKFRHDDDAEYQRREQQKNRDFKALYFSGDEILTKQATVLSRMHDNEVTLAAMGQVLARDFGHCFVTWNSGNFYTLAASRSAENIQAFLRCLRSPALPTTFAYDELPFRLYPGPV